MPEVAEQDKMVSVQAAFDKVTGVIPVKTEPPPPKEQPKPAGPPKEPPPKEAPPEVPPSDGEIKLPSFLEQSLGSKEPTKPAEEELPMEPPAELKDEKAKSNWKRLREKAATSEKELTKLQDELETLRKRGHEPDEGTRLKLEQLETNNKQMAEALTRFGLETSQEFQTKVIQPMHSAYTRARKIVSDAGGDVQAFDKALAISGRAQYEALDEVYSTIPDSAKRAADKALDSFRELNEVRANAVRNAPQTFEQIKRNELLRQKEQLDQQVSNMDQAFEDAASEMTKSGFPLFQESKDPDTAWWNEIKPRILEQAKEELRTTTNMKDPALAVLAKRSLPIVTELWQRALKENIKLRGELAEFRKSEPRLSESGGGTTPTPDEDAKIPFEKLFTKTLRKNKS